jgi:hypothetical protein
LSSWFNRRHTKIVSFEQRRQEVRQIFFEGQLIAGEKSVELNRAMSICENQLIVGKMSEQLKRKFLEGAKISSTGIADNAVVRQEYAAVLKQLDELPSSPSTQARLDLERLAATGIRMKNEQQAKLKELRDAVQSLEDTLKRISQETRSPF